MKRLITLSLLICCLLPQAEAQHLIGIVCDEQSHPVPYASIYLRRQPNGGTVSNNEGLFALDAKHGDTLVISFVGYETQHLPIRSLRGDTVHITLHEQPIMLEEAVVSVPAPRRRNSRKAMKELLRRTSERMAIDFPQEVRKYGIRSSVRLQSQNELITFDEAVGHIVELPIKTQQDFDSVQIKVDQIRRYIDTTIFTRAEHAIERLSSKNKARVQRFDSQSTMHRLLWGTPPKSLFDMLAKKPRHWQLSRESDDLSVLTYTESHNYLGIIKVSVTVNYIVDSYNFSLQRVSQHAILHANIPFGYKLSKDELSVLNVFISGDELEKFRLKYADINLQRNVIFERTPDKLEQRAKEKNLVMHISAADRKGNSLKMKIKTLTTIFSCETKNVRPYTRSELQQPPVRRTVSIGEVR